MKDWACRAGGGEPDLQHGSNLGIRTNGAPRLNRKRPLALAMIRRLHKSLGIPAEVMIAERKNGRVK